MNVLLQHALRHIRKPKRFPRAPVLRSPDRLWKDYRDQLQAEIVDKWKEAAKRLIIEKLPGIQRLVEIERPGGMRTDSWPDELTRQLSLLSNEYDVISKQSADIANGTFMAVNGVSHRQWYEIAKRVMGVDVFSFEPWIASESKAFVHVNVDLITKVQSDVQSDISRIVMGGFQQGKRWETLADEITGSTDLGPGVFDKVETRAELIARDQTTKLYGNLAEKRQAGAGITRYIYRTMEDERVRGDPSGKYPNSKPSHACMDGKVCQWDDPTVYADTIEAADKGKWKSRKNIEKGPGVELHPGQDYQCRCYADPDFSTIFA
jgi:uncharacterized protein with gpF-like domain